MRPTVGRIVQSVFFSSGGEDGSFLLFLYAVGIRAGGRDDLAIEYLGEVPQQCFANGVHVQGLSFFASQGGYPAVRDTARDDAGEVFQIGVDVQCQTVHGHPARGTYADCADLSRPGRAGLYPYSGASRDPRGGHVVVGQGADDRFFHPMHVQVEIRDEIVQIEDGIGNDLPRSVERDVSASVRMVKPDAFFAQAFLRKKQVRGFAVFSQCVNRGMFGEQQMVFGRSGCALGAVVPFTGDDAFK